MAKKLSKRILTWITIGVSASSIIFGICTIIFSQKTLRLTREEIQMQRVNDSLDYLNVRDRFILDSTYQSAHLDKLKSELEIERHFYDSSLKKSTELINTQSQYYQFMNEISLTTYRPSLRIFELILLPQYGLRAVMYNGGNATFLVDSMYFIFFYADSIVLFDTTYFPTVMAGVIGHLQNEFNSVIPGDTMSYGIPNTWPGFHTVADQLTMLFETMEYYYPFEDSLNYYVSVLVEPKNKFTNYVLPTTQAFFKLTVVSACDCIKMRKIHTGEAEYWIAASFLKKVIRRSAKPKFLERFYVQYD